MNTVEKGNIFEKEALEIVKTLVEEELLGVLSNYAKIFVKKKYPSNVRSSGKVEFDLTIEIWPPNSTRYSMIYFIECKNYKTRVPIDKVKKFYADILETSGVNAKGIFISNSPFQKGAFEYASGKGMMLIESESTSDFNIILYKKNIKEKGKIPLILNTLDNKFIDSGVSSLEKIVDKQIFKSFLKSQLKVSYGIDKLSKQMIEDISKKELDSINERFFIHAHGLDKKTIVNYLSREYGIKIQIIKSKRDKNLGTCNIEKKVIKIHESIIGTSRELFVLCHEFGHYILHQKLSINQQLLDSFSDKESNFGTNKTSLENPLQWIEWQANYFSASLLMPRTSLMAMLWKSQQRRGFSKGNLYLDDQRINQKSFYAIVEFLSYHFNVSKTSVIYRLKEYNLITDNSRTKSVGQLIEIFKHKHFM